MSLRARLACTFVLGILALAPGVLAGADQVRIYVSVHDGQGRLVPGLTARDFVVKEGGAPVGVVDAAPATEPLSVVILTDRLGSQRLHIDSTFNAVDMRAALNAMVAGLRAADARTRLGLTTIDGASVTQVGLTSNAGDLSRAIDGLRTNGELSVLFDGVADACDLLSATASDRRAIVALVAGYKEDRDRLPNAPAAGSRVLRTGASFWALDARSSQPGAIDNGHDAFLQEAARLSGGQFARVATGAALVQQAERVARLLAGQYAVTYARTAAPAKTLTVSVSKPGAVVAATTWPPR